MATKDTTVSSACDRGALGVLSLLSLRGGERGAVVPIRVRVHFVLLVPYLTWPRSETVFQGLSYINCRHGLREVGNLYSRDFSSCPLLQEYKHHREERSASGLRNCCFVNSTFHGYSGYADGQRFCGLSQAVCFWRVGGGGSC